MTTLAKTAQGKKPGQVINKLKGKSLCRRMADCWQLYLLLVIPIIITMVPLSLSAPATSIAMRSPISMIGMPRA